MQKYLARTNHMWDGYWLIANGKVWASIPDNLKAIITKNVNASGMAQRDESGLFRFTMKHSIFLASVIGLIVLFYAYVAPGLQP